MRDVRETIDVKYKRYFPLIQKCTRIKKVVGNTYDSHTKRNGKMLLLLSISRCDSVIIHTLLTSWLEDYD